jgi:hypothetical protein
MDLDLATVGKYVGGIGALVGTLYGGGNYVDTRYAHQDDVQLMSMRLDQKILADRAAQLQARRWTIEDRYGLDLAEAPDTVKEEYRRIREELDDLDQEMAAQRAEMRQMDRYGSKDYKRGK